ncbi:MAG: alpha/beta hydrolase [Sphaerochaetaceae bacterium]|nr:lysophospholipase [Sphaerochaetaceae bacterium]MDC7237242.1 alpha/beta hydrolase [Sphaerochaetaceae bacterium]
MKKTTKKILKRVLISIISLIVILFMSFYFYTLSYSRATKTDIEKVYQDNKSIITDDDLTIIAPPRDIDKNIGLIFYPGGKVEDIAYLPLLNQISQSGITCILVKMPFNLAVFNLKAADDIYEKFPNIKSWYLSGHSLGGAMASSYADENYNKLAGLILLASYPLNEAPIKTISIYGSNDYVLDQTKLDNVINKVKIDGANHANFGNYGVQKGDGNATISRDEQQQITVKLITDFILNK